MDKERILQEFTAAVSLLSILTAVVLLSLRLPDFAAAFFLQAIALRICVQRVN